jgi:guanylate kinase
MTPKLIILSAPSGAGKTTLCNRMLALYPDQLVLSISSTTRKPRGAETPGKEYIFVSVDEFKKGIEKNRFAEWAQVHGHYYGTSKDQIEAAFSKGKSVLLDIDVQGAEQLASHYGEQCITVFVSPPNLKTLEARLRTRGTESEAAIIKRMATALEELDRAEDFQHHLINDDLEETEKSLRKIIEPHLKKPGGKLGKG